MNKQRAEMAKNMKFGKKDISGSKNNKHIGVCEKEGPSQMDTKLALEGKKWPSKPVICLKAVHFGLAKILIIKMDSKSLKIAQVCPFSKVVTSKLSKWTANHRF